MKRILVIDDDRSIRTLLQTLLEAEGYVVYTASTSQLGLEKMASFHPDLIVTDTKMPKLGGIGYLLLLLDAETQEYPCKIIVMSSSQSRVYHDRAKRLGADATIEKPLDLALLDALVKEVMTSKQNYRSSHSR